MSEKKERRSFYESFNDEFERQMPYSSSYQSAFHAASEIFRQKVGESPYNSWDSFKSRRSRNKKSKR